MKNPVLLFLLLFALPLPAQPYVSGGNTRHRFAQLNLGFDTRTFLSSGSHSSFVNAAGIIENFVLKRQTETRFIIGGTHFWGHADFYIAIPLLSFGNSGFGTGTETGLKLFPWRLQRNRLRPYAGITWLPAWYHQGEGALQIRHRFPLTAGMVFTYKNNLLELSAGYNYNNRQLYYIRPSTVVTVYTQRFWLSASYKFMIETTLGAERSWQNGSAKKITDSLGRAGKLNGLTLSIGPSSAMFLKPSSHNAAVAPYLGNHQFASVFAEMGIGYYFHRPDLQLNLAYRSINSSISAYGYSQLASRKAMTLETYLFFADYHGFVPFAGLSLGQEWLKVSETNPVSEQETQRWNGLKPGLTFGWDIRPNRLQAWYLRTNLRWVPNLSVKMNSGKTVAFDQLEINFIQLVVFPNRLF